MQVRMRKLLSGMAVLCIVLMLHALFLLLFRPREQKMMKRSPTSRFSVMTLRSPVKEEDPLDLNYWLELDRGAIYSEPAGKTGYSSLVLSAGHLRPGTLSVKRAEKKVTVPYPFAARNPGDIDPDLAFPSAFLDVPEQEHLLTSGGRFRNGEGRVLPGLGTQEILFADQGSGYVFFSVEKDPSGRFPPRIRRIRSSGSSALDRIAKGVLAGRAVSPDSGIRSGKDHLCFESSAPGRFPGENL